MKTVSQVHLVYLVKLVSPVEEEGLVDQAGVVLLDNQDLMEIKDPLERQVILALLVLRVLLVPLGNKEPLVMMEHPVYQAMLAHLDLQETEDTLDQLDLLENQSVYQ